MSLTRSVNWLHSVFRDVIQGMKLCSPVIYSSYSFLLCATYPLIQRCLVKYERGEIPLLPGEPDTFLFPRMLHILGPLHVLYNALEHAIIQPKSWPKYKIGLRALLAFLGWKGTRNRFIHTCLTDPSEISLFTACKRRVIEWKWIGWGTGLGRV